MSFRTTPKKKTHPALLRGGDASPELTQAELAYQELNHRIMIFEIAPNERIVEQAWAGKLKVNRAAIRESLTRLWRGLVYQGQRGGFFVSEMTDEEFIELRQVREILETGAFALACEHASLRQIKDLDGPLTICEFRKQGLFHWAHEADLPLSRVADRRVRKRPINSTLPALSHPALFTQRGTAPGTIGCFFADRTGAPQSRRRA